MRNSEDVDPARVLVHRMLEPDFPGRDELKAQLGQATMEAVLSQGIPAYVFHVPPALPKAPVRQRIPIEAEALDRDGVAIHCLLHVVGGSLSELELLRGDGEPILRLPSPEALVLTVNG